jgi:hypothetical protein
VIYSKKQNSVLAKLVPGSWGQGLLFIVILGTGVHSLFFGAFIYFFTNTFYKLFFSTLIENLFFMRQVGILLFLSGLFYLFPLVNLEKYKHLVLLTVFSKTAAVVFLLTNARFTSSPALIQLAAFGDGFMGVSLICCYLVFRWEKKVKNGK